jgi:hypothetical protein
VAYGYGADTATLSSDDIVNSTLWRTVGQTFAMFNTPLAKASVGAFLLRLVMARWQKIVIYTLLALFSAVTVGGWKRRWHRKMLLA